MNGALEDARSRRFWWGLLLVWVPFLLVIVPGLLNAFRGVSEQKAIGMGAIAGITAEYFATFGFLVSLVFQVTAIVLLLRTLSKEHPARGLLSIISIGCSVFMLLLSGLYVWVIWGLRSYRP
jgi:hypothetical protein